MIPLAAPEAVIDASGVAAPESLFNLLCERVHVIPV